jgi:hypothetical protein
MLSACFLRTPALPWPISPSIRNERIDIFGVPIDVVDFPWESASSRRSIRKNAADGEDRTNSLAYDGDPESAASFVLTGTTIPSLGKSKRFTRIHKY